VLCRSGAPPIQALGIRTAPGTETPVRDLIRHPRIEAPFSNRLEVGMPIFYNAL
jgi:hypothetical protein